MKPKFVVLIWLFMVSFSIDAQISDSIIMKMHPFVERFISEYDSSLHGMILMIVDERPLVVHPDIPNNYTIYYSKKPLKWAINCAQYKILNFQKERLLEFIKQEVNRECFIDSYCKDNISLEGKGFLLLFNNRKWIFWTRGCNGSYLDFVKGNKTGMAYLELLMEF